MKVDNPNNLPTIPIADLVPTQGNLKDLTEKNYNKLKNSIKRRGFYIPVYVWEDDDKVLHMLDGHQRQNVLTTEGWDDPIPYLKVPAKNLQEAAARLLEITSQYGTITQEGIDEFVARYELPESEVFESVSFDAIKFYEVGKELEGGGESLQKSPAEYMNDEELRDSMSMSLVFDKAGFVEFMTYANYFRELYGAETATDAIVQAVREKYEDAIR